MAHTSLPRESGVVLAMLLAAGAIVGCSPTSKAPDYTQQIIDMAASDNGLPGAWSKPSNGLIGRIEAYNQGFPNSAAIFLRLKNVSDRVLTISMRSGDGPPRTCIRFLSSAGWSQQFAYVWWNGGSCSGDILDKVWLEQGEDVVLLLTPDNEGFPEGRWSIPVIQNSVIAVAMTSKATGTSKQDTWSGRLDMPAVMMNSQISGQEHPHLPKVWPLLSPKVFTGANLSGSETILTGMFFFNGDLIGQLESYEDDEVRQEMASQMWTQRRDIQLALLYATLAARAGSEEGKQFILRAIKSNDVEAVRSALDALRYIANPYERNLTRSNWAREAYKAATKDQRPVLDPFDLLRTKFKKEFSFDDADPAPYTVADLTRVDFTNEDELPIASQAASEPAVDVTKMIGIINTSKNSREIRNAIYELGRAGTPQAVETLLLAFSIDFSKRKEFEEFWKDRLYSFSDDIACALREATGQPFGADPAVWRAWWTQKGCKMQKFK